MIAGCLQSRDREIDFDVETAIRVCRGAGYFKQALHLAEKHKLHNWYLKIQLEDIRDYQKALSYMATLDFTQVRFSVASSDCRCPLICPVA